MVVLRWTRAHEQSPFVIDESKIRGVLAESKEESTHIIILLENTLVSGVRANLSLSWLDRNDAVAGPAQQAVTIEHGRTSVELPLPNRTEARAFASDSGTVALPQIAQHVFEIKQIYWYAPPAGAL